MLGERTYTPRSICESLGPAMIVFGWFVIERAEPPRKVQFRLEFLSLSYATVVCRPCDVMCTGTFYKYVFEDGEDLGYIAEKIY